MMWPWAKGKIKGEGKARKTVALQRVTADQIRLQRECFMKLKQASSRLPVACKTAAAM